MWRPVPRREPRRRCPLATTRSRVWRVPAVALRLAFALLRAGDPDAAAQVAESAHAAQPDNPDGLLILGLAQQALALPQAHDTLSRFRAMAPEHPAAAEVRRLLGG